MLLLDPFLQVITSVDEKVLFNKVLERIFEPLIPKMIEKQDNGNEDEETDNMLETEYIYSSDVMQFKRVNMFKIKDALFDIASSNETRDSFRRELYSLVKRFEKELKKGHYFFDDSKVEKVHDSNTITKVTLLAKNDNKNGGVENKLITQNQQKGSKKIKQTEKNEKGENKTEIEMEKETKNNDKKEKKKKKRKLSVDEGESENKTSKSKIPHEIEADEEKADVVKNSQPKAKKLKTEDKDDTSKDVEKEHLPKFVKSKKFKGRLPGYVFKKDKLGVGYYKDSIGSSFDSKDRKMLLGKQKKSKNDTKNDKNDEKNKIVREDKLVPEPDFIKSKKFTGAKKGYVFKKDRKGVGYYKDTYVKPLKGGKNKKKKANMNSANESNKKTGLRRVRFGKNQAQNYKDSVAGLKSWKFDKSLTPTKSLLKKTNEKIPINAKKLNASVIPPSGGKKRRNAASYF